MRTYLEGTETQKQRAYSPAVVTQGGRTVWLAGHTTTQDAEGKDISYNFEAQVRQVFRDLDNTLRRAGGTLVLCHFEIIGYSLRSFTRASSVVNCQ
jgi:enamine deaminase RidA (YjgF/YER057c/UK114 family)